MTPDEIRIEVAECCGWGGFENVEVGGEFLIGVPPHNEITEKLLGPRRISNWTPRCDVPNYPASLDACAEFERTLSFEIKSAKGESEWMDYLEWLGYCGENKLREIAGLVTATPLQRCEAFLRTKEKWKE